MNFDHPSLNKLFGIEKDYLIPFFFIDNPLVYVLKAQKKFRKMARNTTWDELEL